MAAADFQTSEAEVQAIESWRGQLLWPGSMPPAPAPKPAGTPGADDPPRRRHRRQQPPEPLEDLLAELDALVGMDDR